MTFWRLLPVVAGLLLLPALLPSTSLARTGPGDTLVVQTFTWEWPVNPGWLSPKEGRFVFPDRSRRWEKVLMYYTLKCDPRQNPKCGEWDYLTYTYLYDHTGRLDSNRLEHPSFLVNNAAVDTFRAMTAPSRRFVPRTAYWPRQSGGTTSAAIGSGGFTDPHTFGAAATGGRTIHLWRAGELQGAGIPAGSLTGMRFTALDGDVRVPRLVVRMRATSLDAVPDSAGVMGGWTTVFDGPVTYQGAGEHQLPFTWPFAWDGSANVLVDIACTAGSGGMTLEAGELPFTATRAADGSDFYMQFRQRTEINCGRIPEMNDAPALTLEAWLRPDAFVDWGNLGVKSLSNSNRFGIQLGPRNDGNVDVYGLVGKADNHHGYTTTRPLRADRWYHIAMVYNGTGADNPSRLKIYIDGVEQTLSFSGTIPATTSTNNASFSIAGTGTNTVIGGVDDMRLWRRALTPAEINARRFANIESTDPLFASLISAWSMDEGSGTQVSDVTGLHDGIAAPPQWKRHGAASFRNLTARTTRPLVAFGYGATVTTPDAAVVIDTIPDTPLLVVRYGDTTRANVPTDTLYRWPQYRTYTFDVTGRAIDSVLVAPDEVHIRTNHGYYSAPFEVVDRYELGRYITPYGIGLDLGEGWTWVYDVTDFQQFLTDSVHLTAGNFQELLDMKFVFIEGTPPRDVKNIRNVWNGTYALNTFAQQVKPKTFTLGPDTRMARLRTTATGHDFDNATNCAEFCPKLHWIDVNGTRRHSWQIIQECADNPLYPQGGTWIYDRAGWCPGMPATITELELTPFITGSEVTVGYGCEADQFGRYVFESQLVEYGDPNHTLDATLAEIRQPSSYELHKRFNPICDRPQIVLRNTGATDLTSCDIEYGVVGKTTQTYRWTGRLGFLQSAVVILPSLPWTDFDGGGTFSARVRNPNNGTDEYPHNDVRTSTFTSVPVYTQQLYIYFRTNLAGNENYYRVYDASGAIVHQKDAFVANTLYRDTLRLAPGCYTFVMSDRGDDGISFWANNDGTGNLSLRLIGGGSFRSVPGDFGKEARLSFVVATPTGVEAPPVAARSLAVYPNPATSRLAVEFALDLPSTARFEMYDVTGRLVRSVAPAQYGAGVHTVEFDAHALESGVYMVRMYQGDAVTSTTSVRIIR